jgi:hypothetical protein
MAQWLIGLRRLSCLTDNSVILPFDDLPILSMISLFIKMHHLHILGDVEMKQ